MKPWTRFDVTLRQVELRVSEARAATFNAVEHALESESQTEYDSWLGTALHHAQDYETWKKVLDAIKDM